MTFTFQETPESRAQSYGAVGTDAVTLIYKAVGEQNDATVRTYAAANAPATVTGLYGTLYRREITLRPDGFQQYFVEVQYGNFVPTNSYTFNFDTSGGTTNVQCAKSHVRTYPVNGDFHKGAIGVEQDGRVSGVDVISPKLRLNFAFKFPAGRITAAYVKTLAAATGKLNLYRFIGFDPGELLFLGASGSDGTNSEMEVTFSFEASSNATNFASGGITGISKLGHEYLWHEFSDAVDTGVAVTRASRVHIEQVYDYADFQNVFGWNIFTG